MIRYIITVIFAATMSASALSQDDRQKVLNQEVQSLLGCLGIADAMERSTSASLDAAGLLPMMDEISSVREVSTTFLVAIGATEEQISNAVAERRAQAQTLLREPEVAEAQGTFLSAPFAQCVELVPLLTKDKCALSGRTMPELRIPFSYYKYAKTCREEQALLARSEPASTIIGNAEAEARFAENKARAAREVYHYDRIFQAQPIAQCGRFWDEYNLGRERFWNRATDDFDNLLADGVIDYYNVCGDFKKLFEEFDDAKPESSSE